MGFYNCNAHGLRVPNYSECPQCQHEAMVEESLRNQERMARERVDLARQRAADDGVCECCGQRFVERTRVTKPTNKTWTGVLARYANVGVCPACANKHGAF